MLGEIICSGSNFRKMLLFILNIDIIVYFLQAVAHDSWEKLVTNADLESWKQVLCALVVYCQQDRRLKLAGMISLLDLLK